MENNFLLHKYAFYYLRYLQANTYQQTKAIQLPNTPTLTHICKGMAAQCGQMKFKLEMQFNVRRGVKRQFKLHC